MARRKPHRALVRVTLPDVAVFKLPNRVSSVFKSASPLRMLEDRRTFDPRGVLRPPSSFIGKARVVARKATHPTWPGIGLKFDIPRPIAICIRRKERKEVLFAKRKAGRGGSRKPPRRSFWSGVSCK